MTNKFLVTAFFTLCMIMPMGIKAQDKQLSLEDLTPGGRTYSRFTPRSVKQLKWCGDKYFYVKGDSALTGVPGTSKKESVLFTLQTLNKALSAQGLKEQSSLPAFTVPYKKEPILAFSIKKRLLHYNYKTDRIVANYQVLDEWKGTDFCPATGNLAYNDGNNLEILAPGNTISKVSEEKNEAIVYGQSVHRNEFGINKGTFWSPSGKSLAFYRMDETMVTDYPLVNVNARCAKLNAIKYPMAGMKSHEVTVGVYQVDSAKIIYLDTDTPKDRYFTNIAWSPDEKYIYIAEVNREQNECCLNRYNAVTGKMERTLFKETSNTYVEPQHPMLFLKNDPTKFIWQSNRDGYNHLYLYGTDGTLHGQITKGAWEVTSVLGFDATAQNLFYTSTEVSPLERHLYKVNMQTNRATRLTSDKGMHNVQLSASGNYFIDSYSSTDNPGKINIASTGRAKPLNLLTATDPFKNYDFPEITLGTIKAANDSTDLHYRLITPVNYDPSKKYPAIIYVYGGPHAQLVTDSWMGGARGWEIYMAQRGYVLFTVDSRGSANRGAAFENVIHRNLGVNEMADQVKGAQFLKSLPYVDAERIGVHGWSYGGFMTTNLLLSYPDIFKVGVAGGPVIDWSYYEIMYGERYMDTPQENPEGYKNANLNNKAANLKGRLLLIHGDIDPVVVLQHSLSFLNACVNARTYPDYYIYPGHEHNVIGKDRVHLHEKITRYFDDYLK